MTEQLTDLHGGRSESRSSAELSRCSAPVSTSYILSTRSLRFAWS